MTDGWLETVPVLTEFSQAAEAARYVPVPDTWSVGISDVVNSTGLIAEGRYKSVNMAGAATISAVTNALAGDLPLLTFGGDGARMVFPPHHAAAAETALRRVTAWAARDLGLDMRVGLVEVAEVQRQGYDVRAAFWEASAAVRYGMFGGQGIEWVDKALKSGEIGLTPAGDGAEPDLTGLSCQWGPIKPGNGQVVSLIVKPGPEVDPADYVRICNTVISLLDEAGCLSPVPESGPGVRWPGHTIALQSRIARRGYALWRRRLRVLATTTMMWLVFKLGMPVGRFRPARYRREIAENTDFRKFDDGLILTVDCSPAVRDALVDLLDAAENAGTVRYGLHAQQEAQMTCIVPSALSSDHMHFVDGAGGGYAAAAQQLRD